MRRIFTNDALSDSIYSLKMVSHFLAKVWEESQSWKWVIIALHNSLQGFMACAIRGSDGVAAIKDRTRDRRHIKGYLKLTETKLPKLLDFMDLYERIKDPEVMCRMCGSKEFQASDSHDRLVDLLNEVRNELTHYFPNLHMMSDVADWLPMIRGSAEIIEFLCFQSDNFFMPANDDRLRPVREVLEEIRKQVDLIQAEMDKAI